MAMALYGAANCYLTINGVTIEAFGQSDPPYTISWDENLTTLIGGVGNSSVQLDNIRTPGTLVVNLIPGSDEQAQLTAMANGRVPFTATHRVGGSTETVTMFDAAIQNIGDFGRAGKGSVTDFQVTIRFMDSQIT